jgi:hypothetical protein
MQCQRDAAAPRKGALQRKNPHRGWDCTANGHMMMLEQNSAGIAAVIADWLEAHVN